MVSLGVDAGSDLGPWAAYVVGRHPYALAGWHTESWAMRESGSILDRGHLYGAPQELEELDEALTILACQGRVDSAVLDSYRRSLGRFVATSKEIYENSENPLYGSEEIDWEAEAAPSNPDLLIMMMDQSKLITGPEELRLWERCGAIIGECLLPTSCLVSAWRWESPQQGYDALVGAFQHLTQTGDYPFLAECVDRLTELDFQSVWQA